MSAVILRRLSVQNLGTVEAVSLNLTEGLNLIRTRYDDELIYAIRLLMHHAAIPPFPSPWIRADTRIEAAVTADGTDYAVTLLPRPGGQGLILTAYDPQDRDVTEPYAYLCAHCAEQDLSEVFDGEGDRMLLRFLQYANEDLFFAPRELSERTEGLSDLRAFRAYLREYIENFTGETIREGKQYEIIPDRDGRYAVRHRGNGEQPVLLSESEGILFRYLCFLRTAEFWRGFEELRNLHGIRKPLLIRGFLNRLDESIDLTSLLRRTAELHRQVIILS